MCVYHHAEFMATISILYHIYIEEVSNTIAWKIQEHHTVKQIHLLTMTWAE